MFSYLEMAVAIEIRNQDYFCVTLNNCHRLKDFGSATATWLGPPLSPLLWILVFLKREFGLFGR
jgi:hypothetical protein